jgi:ubiquinone/menaquinone biosynthesis C-methylase UbiE
MEPGDRSQVLDTASQMMWRAIGIASYAGASRLRRITAKGGGWRVVGWMERAAGKHSRADAVPLRDLGNGDTGTPVDRYWGRYNVNPKPFCAAAESRRYLEWRASEYPHFLELMGLYGDHDGEVVLDYGCGPGDDTVGFALFSRAKRIIGIDLSRRSLELARGRLALHPEAAGRVELIRTADLSTKVPLDDACVDYLHCGGVLHHVSNPDVVLAELNRVLKPGAEGCVMVYNRRSLWFHLYTAYVRRLLEGRFRGMTVREAFHHNIDGKACPIAHCYTAEEFVAICQRAGFEAEFAGAYLSRIELTALRHRESALHDPRMEPEHLEFLRDLTFEGGLPHHGGTLAGVGGVYRLRKAASAPTTHA